MKQLKAGLGVAIVIVVVGLAGCFLLTKSQAEAESTVLIASSDMPNSKLHSVVTFRVDGRSRSLAEAFTNAGVNYYSEDKISAFPDPRLGLGSLVRVERALLVNLQDGKQGYQFRTWQNTVGQLLQEKNIELGQDDLISPALNTPLSTETKINIVRVAITTIKETEPVDFKIIKKEDNILDQGKTRVDRAGAKGVRTKTFEVRREDGVEVARTLQKNEITTAAVDQLLIIGTRPVITVDCRFNSLVIDAALKYGVDPNQLCYRMMRESRGNPSSDGGIYKGLFQYEANFWTSVSAKAGFSGASIWDAKAQIYTTAWAWTHGLRGRWPSP